MERRDLFQAAGLATLAGLAGQAFAQQAAGPASDPHAGHRHHHHHGAKGPSALTVSAADCLVKGETCLAHCIELMGQGDKEMAGCAASVNQMLAMCTALQKVSVQNGSQLKSLARAVAAACDDCEKECRKHASKHAECKACGEACVECAKQCKATAG